ncbi:MAG: molybdopterin molybdotransferase MoeA [Bacteroidales bacterium]|nr:molybdopterin molybdotransferase MoeA [Bacteroidales bacterium]
MISLTTAIDLVNANCIAISETEIIPLNQSIGRVLAESVLSDVDMPPFNKSAMDGYACRREDLELPLEVIETIPAGTMPQKTILKGQCTKIMTGAKVPDGADCVVMVEQTTELSKDTISINDTKTQTNICFRGEDIKYGSEVLSAGTRITAQILATLASVGKTNISVTKQPQVAFFCTGSELVEPDVVPTGVTIRNSNSSQIIAQIEEAGAQAHYHGIITDSRSLITTKIDELIRQNDLVIITGGASVGDFDFIPQILQESGFQMHFQKVGIQPGKPVLYATKKGKHIFGLSGNPVSSFLQCELLVKPLISNLLGTIHNKRNIKAVSGDAFKRKNSTRVLFLPVALNQEGEVVKTEFHGSAHIAGLKNIFGFAIMGEGVSEIKKGEIVDVRPL